MMAVALSALKTPMAGLVLTGGLIWMSGSGIFARPAWKLGCPFSASPIKQLGNRDPPHRMDPEVPEDDLERVQLGMDHVARYIDADWIASPIPRFPWKPACPRRLSATVSPSAPAPPRNGSSFPRAMSRARSGRRPFARSGISPAAFCWEIPKRSKASRPALKSSCPRTSKSLIRLSSRANYVNPLVEMRKHKGLTPDAAAELLKDNVWLGTVMLALDEVDGLVSGAVHSTANTIRPALQIIKTKAGAKVVSSIFFMCLPDQVVVYGDCAVNPDPDAETLADIAIQSADSAERFGIPPRVAMISYSTGESGSGADVDKVREATRIAKAKRPDLMLDGPLQYDAAAMADVAAPRRRAARSRAGPPSSFSPI